jgi:uncharacterized membrane protein YphA (DoxX/SURF4 family)
MEKTCNKGICVLQGFLGLVFVMAGVSKLFMLEFVATGFTSMFGEAGMFLMWIVIAAEALGGLALLLGFHAMEASLVLAIVMIVAFVKTFALPEGMSIIALISQILTTNQIVLLVGLIAIALQGCKRCMKSE